MIEKLQQVLGAIEIETTVAQVDALHEYCALVLEWNSRVNITGAKSVEAFAEGPLFDALTLLSVLGEHQRLVDIGSGGGLPAVPMAILRPNLQVTMVEPRLKRVMFLKKIVERFGLKATVLHTQDRELDARQFDGASAQAVFPPKKWISRAKKLVVGGGAIYTLTSEPVTPAMLPNNVTIETQKTFSTKNTPRYAGRLRVSKNIQHC